MMADGAEDMGLATVLVDHVAHRLAVDGQALVLFAMHCVPALQGAIQMFGIDADEYV